MKVQFKNPKIGELKDVKVGWSWTLFFFSGCLGIPLFLRGLHIWGGIMAGLWVVSLLLMNNTQAGIIISLAMLGLDIFLAIKGNEMTAKNYLEKGWEFFNSDSEIVKLAKTRWKIAA